jgi:bifunctional ADP-heptose synthase (sugar kinase/adenylyltransferase)
MFSGAILQNILERIPSLTLAVVGDLFLDRYLDIDATLTEPSLETGLDAYQVAHLRSYPGAAGTVINNLAALGVGKIYAISFLGDDGEGYELRGALADLGVVDTDWVLSAHCGFRTPTYTKPMLHRIGQPPRELNRFDIKNRTPLPASAGEETIRALGKLWPQVDALLVVDQVSEPDCGVISHRVRDGIAELGDANPQKLILADSRERIGLFRSVTLKPNEMECLKAVGSTGAQPDGTEEGAAALAQRAGRPVFCTCGERGMLVVDPRSTPPPITRVPAYPVAGPVDLVGAGDSTSAGLACALAAGASLAEAAAFGNLVASITIQQIGATGTASQDQVRHRWREVQQERENIRSN